MNEDHEKMKRLLEEVVQDEDYRAWRDSLRGYLCDRMERRAAAERMLLGEVIHDESYLDFRGALRRRCLEELPAPRWDTWLLRTALLAAGAAAALLLILLHPRALESVALPEAEPGYVVRSHGLSACQQAANRMARTVRSRDHGFASSAMEAGPSSLLADAAYIQHTDRRIEIIRTHDQESKLERLSDRELLALFDPRPCAIIHVGGERPILHFFD